MKYRHFAFAEEYLIDLNGTKAAIRVGYVEAGAGTEASRLLKNPQVARLLELLKLNRSRRTAVTADRVIQQIAKIAFADPSQFMIYDEEGNCFIRDLDDVDVPEAIKGIKVKEQFDRGGNRTGKIADLTLADPLRALELLGKHTAAFTENLNLTTNGKDLPANQTTVNVVINHRRRKTKDSTEEE